MKCNESKYMNHKSTLKVKRRLVVGRLKLSTSPPHTYMYTNILLVDKLNNFPVTFEYKL